MDTSEIKFSDDARIRRQGTKGEQSTGLGMKIVKEIVDIHNGTINVVTAPGAGTTFEIFIPKA